MTPYVQCSRCELITDAPLCVVCDREVQGLSTSDRGMMRAMALQVTQRDYIWRSIAKRGR